jgi:hypothetical protein
MQWGPRFRVFFAKGGYHRTSAAAELGHSIAERNLRPALVDAHRPRFVQKIETITAPAPLLRRADQAPFHRIAMHVAELLHALLGRPYVEVVGARLPERSATIAVGNKIAFIGVYNADTSDPPENGNAMIYGFDYTQSAEPRLVYLGANGVIADAVLTIRSVGNNLFAGITNALTEFDATQPRNAVNLLFLPSALRPPVYLEPSLRARPSGEQRLQPNRPVKGKLPFALPAQMKYH